MTPNPEPNQKIIVYGHNYCPQVGMVLNILKKYQIDYEWRDVREGDLRFQAELQALAKGFLSVPTLVFPDGTVMVEPWRSEVLQKLGLK
jgi:mycoredoxin